MKTVSILLALVNSLAASLVFAASLPVIQILRPTVSLWYVTKVSASITVILAGILTWVTACRKTSSPNLILVTGLLHVALGTASAVWTIHLAVVNGVIKEHMFLFGGSLMAQGTACIWNLIPPGRTVTGV